MPDKEFKTIEQQIALLKGRGLQIPDSTLAADFLYRNNYYRVSGYSLTLRRRDEFVPGTTFQNIIDIYEFDHALRHTLLKYIEVIEVTVKSIYSHEFTKIYGPAGYLNPENFTDASTHKRIMQKVEEQKASRLPHEAYLKHFVNELRQDIPLWALVDLLTISDISYLYKISESPLQQAVANALGIEIKGREILGKFMHSMTIIRNLCAHGGRLYNRLFEQKPWLSKQEKALLRSLPNGTVDNAHLYSFIMIMRRLLKPNEFLDMKNEIRILSQKYAFVDLRYYGFREDWQTVL